MAASLLLLPTQSSQTRSAPQTAILESENRESAAAKRETERGTRGRGERLHGGCYGEGAMGEDGREGERIKTWGSFVPSPPLVSATRVREARAEGLAVAAPRLACFEELLLNQYHILIHCLGREVVALKRQNRFEYFILMVREDVCVKTLSVG